MGTTRWLLFLMLSALHPFAYGQDVDSLSTQRLGWIRVAAGIGGAPKFAGMAFNLTASYLTGDGVFAIRYGGVATLSFESVKPEVQTEGVAELSGMYGISYRHSILLITASTGLGVVQVLQSGPSGRQHATTVGIPLDFQVMISPLRVIGLGVVVSGNLNLKQSFGSVMIGMQFGLVR